MSRALKYDIPGPDWRIPFERAQQAGLAALFEPLPAPSLRLIVDIGFGRGEFLTELARRDPASAILGIEYSYKRVLKLARRLARSELGNVRLIEAPAERVVEELLPEESVSCFWINFPDPWPKKRHHRRRLLQAPFVHALARCLAPGGEIHAATDHAEYAEQMDATLRGEPQLDNAYAPEPFRRRLPGRFPTAYEREWSAEGRSFHYFCYRRKR